MSDAPAEIVGFDLGHGETAVARADLATVEVPLLLEIHGRKNQITAIAEHPELGTLVGEDALTSGGAVRLDISFKRAPAGGESDELLSRYFARCVEHLRESRQIGGGARTRLFVGAPSGWAEPAVRRYEELLRAPGAADVTVLPESRAAFMQAREEGLFTVGELRSSVLVIDIGSSTTDVTLVENLTARPVDFGSDLGAALIDRALFDRTLAAHPRREEIRWLLDAHPMHRALCELACRRAKESYFSHERLYADPARRPATGYAQLDARLSFAPAVNGAVMGEILAQPSEALGGLGWRAAFRRLLTEARDRVAALGREPSAILLTGGASRMQFTLDDCQAVFSGARIVRDPEPEFCIARGLARAGRVDLRAEGFVQAMESLASRELPAMLAARLPALTDRIVGGVSTGVAENALLPALREWRAGLLPALDDVAPRVRSMARDWLATARARHALAQEAAAWFAPLREEINRRTDAICQEHRIPARALALEAALDPASLSLPPELHLGDPTLLSAITDAAGLLGALVVAALLGGGGVALVLSGPGGWILGLALGLAAAGKGAGPAKRRLQRAVLPGAVRRMVLRDALLERQSAAVRDRLAASMRDHLRLDPAPLDGLLASITRQFREDLMAKVEEARILIR